MKTFMLIAFWSISFCYANVGTVLKYSGDPMAYLIRNGNKVTVSQDMKLNLNDEIYSNGSLLLIQLGSGTQISIGEKTRLKILERLSVELSSGVIRAEVNKENFNVQAKDVAFSVEGTEFEVSCIGEDFIDLDVVEGEIVVSSPHVHTFVPEVIKAKEGFRFIRKPPGFQKREFSPKLKKYLQFKKIPRR